VALCVDDADMNYEQSLRVEKRQRGRTFDDLLTGCVIETYIVELSVS
jgi:hypothetical protein